MRAILLITFLVSLTFTAVRPAASTTPPPPPDPPRGEFPWQL